jgi:hypothetical protein
MRSRCCVCVCVCIPPLSLLENGSVKMSPILARQRLGRNVSAVTNTHAKIYEFLEASISMWPVSYQGKCLVLPRTSFEKRKVG